MIVATLLSTSNPAQGQEVIRNETNSSPEKSQADEIATLIEELASPFFIVRQKATSELGKIGPDAEPHLRRGIESSEPLIVAGCISLLTCVVPDEALRKAVMEHVEHPAQAVQLKAIAFLASHPDPDDQGAIDWACGLLNTGSIPQRRAYVDGVRRPAPSFQTGLIVDALPILPQTGRAPALRALARGQRGDAAACLARCYGFVTDGRLDESLVPLLLDSLAECALPSSLDTAADALLFPSPLVRQKAGRVLAGIITHLSRMNDYSAIIGLNRRLACLFNDDHGARLDIADALIRYGQDLSEAKEIALDVTRALRSDDSTGALILRSEACLALALIAFEEKQPWRPSLNDLPLQIEQTPGDFAKSIRARALLIEGALTAAQGGDGTGFFLKAIEAAPYEPDTALIDSLLTGRFSLWRFVWKLSRRNGEAECGAVLSQLTTALRQDASRCNYYPPAEDLAALDDRARSSLPMTFGSFLRSDAGDLAAAVRQLDDFVGVVQESMLWRNLDLTTQALFVRGAAEMELGDFARARQSIGKGVKICEDLLSEYKGAQEREGFRVYGEMIENAERIHALGLLQLATIETLTNGKPALAARLVSDAHRLAPELTEVRMARALVLARAGHKAQATKIGAAVEEYPEQFYNKACLFLLVGEKQKALDYAERHFKEYVRPLRLKLARAWALRDPDLKGLRNTRRFEELTGAGE